MAKDWIHRPNSEFNHQARGFSQLVSADPARYQISAEDAALLAAAYADFAEKFQIASPPGSRTAAAVIARNDARKRLAGLMRDLGGRIRSNRSISNQDKLLLSITIPRRENKALIALPATKPQVRIDSVVQNILTLRIQDFGTSRWARPQYVTGAEVFFAIGEEQPTSGSAWQRGCITLSSKAKIFLPMVPPGTKVWLCARWFNTHGAGPVSNCISTHVTITMAAPGAVGSGALLAA